MTSTLDVYLGKARNEIPLPLNACAVKTSSRWQLNSNTEKVPLPSPRGSTMTSKWSSVPLLTKSTFDFRCSR